MAKLQLTSVLLALLVSVLYGVLKHSAPSPIGARAAASLKFLLIVGRHGNRAPLFAYPAYPYPANNTDIWPYGAGQLTRKGRQQMYELGKKIRSLYDGFLEEGYYKEKFKAFSTSIDRTLMSAQLFLAGLFPPKGVQVWSDQLLWQPVPVFQTIFDHTQLLAVKDPERLCPRFARGQKDSMDLFYEENGPDMTAMLESIRPDTGMEPETSSRAFTLRVIWDSLICAAVEGKSLPSWTSTVYPLHLESLMAKAEVASTIGTHEMIRLLQGQLFQEMADLLNAKANGSLTPDRSTVYYSGHDMTIRGLQGVLGLNESFNTIIRPGSALVLELHEDAVSDQHYVQVLYIDGSSAQLEPTPLSIGGCQSPCPLDVLLSITETYYNIRDYNFECKIDQS